MFSIKTYNDLSSGILSSKKFILNNKLDEITFNTYVQFKNKSLPNIFFFHGAINQNITKLPHFVGTSFYNRLDFNCIHFSDPFISIDKSIQTGWYLGNHKINFHDYLGNFIKEFNKTTETNSNILFGSSGGGFPCLSLSQKFKFPIIINSPCTTLISHPNKNLTNNFFSFAYGDFSHKKINNQDLDFNSNYEVKGKIIYFLNINDKRNIKFFSGPFLSQFKINIEDLKEGVYIFNENIKLIIFTSELKHTYPNTKDIINAINDKFLFE